MCGAYELEQEVIRFRSQFFFGQLENHVAYDDLFEIRGLAIGDPRMCNSTIRVCTEAHHDITLEEWSPKRMSDGDTDQRVV